MQPTRSVDVPEVCKQVGIRRDTASYRVPVLFDQVIQVPGSTMDGRGWEEFPAFVGHTIQCIHVFGVPGVVKPAFTGGLGEVAGVACLRPKRVEITT